MSDPEKHSWPRLFLLRDDIVSQTLAEGNHWNPHVYDALEPYLAGGTVLDIGANVGGLALRFAEKAQQVYAFEPNLALAGCLQENVKLLGVRNLMVFTLGVYSRDVSLRPVVRADSPSSWPWLPGGGSSGAGASTLPGWLAPPITAIKVDVQGADLHALMGCRRAVEKSRPAIVFEFEDELSRLHGHRWEDYTRWFGEARYKIKPLGQGDWLGLPEERG